MPLTIDQVKLTLEEFGFSEGHDCHMGYLVYEEDSEIKYYIWDNVYVLTLIEWLNDTALKLLFRDKLVGSQISEINKINWFFKCVESYIFVEYKEAKSNEEMVLSIKYDQKRAELHLISHGVNILTVKTNVKGSGIISKRYIEHLLSGKGLLKGVSI